MHLVQQTNTTHTVHQDSISARSLFRSFWLSVFLFANPAHSETTQNGLQEMLDAAHQALIQQWHSQPGRVEIDMASVDPRLQVPRCNGPLLAQPNQSGSQNLGGRVTVRVECQDSAAPWSRHVAAMVRIYRPVVIVNSAVARGAVISAQDISLEERDISQLRGQLLDQPDQVLGMAVRRALNAGSPVTLDLLTAPVLVRRGETIVLNASRGGATIRQTGVAMQDGEAGKQIPVRNSRSNRVVQAVVTAAGEAQVVF